ncbi:MAG: hypothetical protein P8M30_10140 [Planctomycetaceae bacterium]|nr:hypothetical protein [Planctomycetaceae bacterium]
MTLAKEYRIELSGYDSLCSTNPTYGLACIRVSLRLCVIIFITQTRLAKRVLPELVFIDFGF